MKPNSTRKTKHRINNKKKCKNKFTKINEIIENLQNNAKKNWRKKNTKQNEKNYKKIIS